MSTASHIRRVATTGALTALMTVGLAGGAMAAESDAPAGTPAPGKTVSKADRQQAKSISIKEIIRKADPTPIPRAKGLTETEPEAPDGPAVKVPGTRSNLSAGSPTRNTSAPAPAVASAQNGLWTGAFNANPNKQVGKLYYDMMPGPGVNWNICSGTAVNSENKSVVITAGHCIFENDPGNDGSIDGDGFWFEDVMFCPGYEYGCKLGVYHARYLSTTSSWFYGTGGQYDSRDDMAAVVVSPNSQGKRLVNAVGGHGIAFNQNVSLNRHAFGYPAYDSRWPQYNYNGEDLIYCPGRDAYDNAGHVRINCTMTGGASGGGWLHGISSAWMGTLNGVNSFKPTPQTVASPYFGNAESAVFQNTRTR